MRKKFESIKFYIFDSKKFINLYFLIKYTKSLIRIYFFEYFNKNFSSIFRGIVAQRLEQDAHNVLVAGSIPADPTI